MSARAVRACLSEDPLGSLWCVGEPKDKDESESASGREKGGGGRRRRTVDDPALDFGRGYLQHRGNLRVWQVLPDVLKAKICENQQADFVIKLSRIQAYLFPRALIQVSDAK